MFVDNLILNGQPHGEIAEILSGSRFDVGLLRPYKDQHGHACVTVNTGKKYYDPKSQTYKPEFEKKLIRDLAYNHNINIPVSNATTLLRKDEWIELDRQVLLAARQRLRAWTDLSNANSFGGFNAMAKTILEHETMSDPGEAFVDMDGLADVRGDTPLYQLEGLPLPITHSGFRYSQRQLATSRNSGTPLDTSMGEAASRRVAESIEKTCIGVNAGITFGVAANYSNGAQVYGYTTHPDRINATTLTTPDGTNGTTTLTEILGMRDALHDAFHYGPYIMYTSTGWDQYLDNLFSTTEPSAGTLRENLLKIDGISDIRRLDFLTSDFTVILVQMTSNVARAINGMPITLVQWENKGGLELNFKVMAIQVPQVRADFNGNTGIAHYTD